MNYEYKVVNGEGNKTELVSFLNSYGETGWQLCAWNGTILIFKREIV